MKKLILSIAMITVLATLLCACGGATEPNRPTDNNMPSVDDNAPNNTEDNNTDNEDNENEDNENEDNKDSEEDALKKSILGEWSCLDLSEDYYCERPIVFYEDGTVTFDEETYNWEISNTQSEDYVCSINFTTLPTEDAFSSWCQYTFSLTIMEDGNYKATLRNKFKSFLSDYYRVDDYKDYDVIELTPDNIADYLEITQHIYLATTSNICNKISIRFKEEFGTPSTCVGVLICRIESKSVTVRGDNDYTVGETIEVYEDALNYGRALIIHPIYGASGTETTFGCDYDSELDQTYGHIGLYEIIGAEDGIYGKVFVPKK